MIKVYQSQGLSWPNPISKNEWNRRRPGEPPPSAALRASASSDAATETSPALLRGAVRALLQRLSRPPGGRPVEW